MCVIIDSNCATGLEILANTPEEECEVANVIVPAVGIATITTTEEGQNVDANVPSLKQKQDTSPDTNQNIDNQIPRMININPFG